MKIQDLLTKELICFDVKSTEKLGVIEELTEFLVADNRVVDKDKYVSAVMAREDESSTGIGMGVAIPHGKSSAVKKASLAFGRSVSGVEFASMDDEPVHIIFLIAVPEEAHNEHLKILSRLSRKLIHKEVRESLMKASTAEEIYQIFGTRK